MKKKPSGIIIRLIDVVLILLFGFISISQIEDVSKINLPVSSQTTLSTPDTENLITVAIFPYERDQWGFLVENETKLLKRIEGVHVYLLNKKEYYRRDIRVKIFSEARAPIKYMMQVADLCEQLQLKKSLIVRLKERQSGLNTSLE